jgi:hypothetical protein
MTLASLAVTARGLAETLPTLLDELAAAQSIQWEPAPVPSPRDDTSERSKGGRSDPTARAVFDERRLRVRAAVVAAERVLETALHDARDSLAGLRSAVAEWEGDTP